MKKVISFLMAVFLSVTLSACKDSDTNAISTEQDAVKAAIETYLAPQVQAYKDAFGIEDLSVDVQFTEYSVCQPIYNTDGSVGYYGSIFCTIRDIIVSPSVFQKLENGEFTDEILRQLSAIDFSYPTEANSQVGIPYGDYEIYIFSRLAVPKFADADGNEYAVTDGILVKDDIIMYLSPNVHLEVPAKVGDNIKSLFSAYGSSSNSGATKAPSGTTCPNCKGSGYVKYHYGDSDLQAYLDGYDPYTVGKCTTCSGKGYY